MSNDPQRPVIAGVGQLLQRCADPAQAEEPLELMDRALRGAAEDAGAPELLSRADSIRVAKGLWDLEVEWGLGAPTHMYSLFENTVRHWRGESPRAHRDRIAELWAGFSASLPVYPAREALETYDGAATVESFAVHHGADGDDRLSAACRTPDDRRAWAGTTDPSVLEALTSEELCGRDARIDRGGELRLI